MKIKCKELKASFRSNIDIVISMLLLILAKRTFTPPETRLSQISRVHGLLIWRGLSKNKGAFFKPDDQPCWLHTCKVQDLVSQPLLQ